MSGFNWSSCSVCGSFCNCCLGDLLIYVERVPDFGFSCDFSSFSHHKAPEQCADQLSLSDLLRNKCFIFVSPSQSTTAASYQSDSCKQSSHFQDFSTFSPILQSIPDIVREYQTWLVSGSGLCCQRDDLLSSSVSWRFPSLCYFNPPLKAGRVVLPNGANKWTRSCSLRGRRKWTLKGEVASDEQKRNGLKEQRPHSVASLNVQMVENDAQLNVFGQNLVFSFSLKDAESEVCVCDSWVETCWFSFIIVK